MRQLSPILMVNHHAKMKKPWLLLKVKFLLLLLVTTTACSSLGEKFTASEKVNYTPFATYTIEMVKTLDYGLERDDAVLMRSYLQDENNKELARLIELDDKLYNVLREIVAYSTKVVRLAGSSISEQQQVAEYVGYLLRLEKPGLKYHFEHGSVTEKEFEDLLKQIKQKEDLLEAMKAAKPLIDYMLQYTEFLNGEIKKQELRASEELANVIDNEFSVEIKYYEMLVNNRNIILTAMLTLDDYYKGDKSALRRLEKKNVTSRLDLKTKKIEDSTVKQLKYELIQEFSEIQAQFKLLEPDYDVYIKTHQELDQLTRYHDEEVRQAKEIIQLWSQAHQKMANGVTDPADWFDITNTGGLLFGYLGSKLK